MIDRGISEDAFQIPLREGGRGGKDNRDHRQPEQRRAERAHLFGKNRQQDAQKTINAHFRHHAGEQHGRAARRFGVSRRQPRVKRHQRHFDGEAEKHAEEQGMSIMSVGESESQV